MVAYASVSAVGSGTSSVGKKRTTSACRKSAPSGDSLTYSCTACSHHHTASRQLYREKRALPARPIAHPTRELRPPPVPVSAESAPCKRDPRQNRGVARPVQQVWHKPMPNAARKRNDERPRLIETPRHHVQAGQGCAARARPTHVPLATRACQTARVAVSHASLSGASSRRTDRRVAAPASHVLGREMR